MSNMSRKSPSFIYLEREEITDLKIKASISYLKQMDRRDAEYVPELCCPDLKNSNIYVVENADRCGKDRHYVRLVIDGYFAVFRVRPDKRLRRLKRYPDCLAYAMAPTADQWRDMIYRDLDLIFEELNRMDN
ncbi:hypothetical protein [Methylobacterium dankookense]|uniref:hypothetical protein n=1 Tax=Methylobacterium dankookense TaxID=560405 RepID=UPI0011A858EE|nr:hypothetical protein [Methylobacterium dankookense]